MSVDRRLLNWGVFLVLLIVASVLVYWHNDWTAERVAGFVTRNLLSSRGYALSREGFRWRWVAPW